MFKVKRIYEDRSSDDGTRYLVDRVWPRGISKEKAGLDDWLKELAPSHDLRTWFQHDPAKWEGFQERYREELSRPAALSLLQRLRNEAEHGVVTLLFAAKDLRYNNAAFLKNILEEK